MIKFENTEVMGWEAAIRGMRNPMNSWEKSDSYFLDCDGDMYGINGNHAPFYGDDNGNGTCVGENDLSLMKKLRNAGTDHRKFMRMITVYVDITAPLYWWKEFDTYKVGTVANSCSTMHKIHEKEFTIDDFSHEHLMSFGEGSMIFEGGDIVVDTKTITDAASGLAVSIEDNTGVLYYGYDDVLDLTIIALNKAREKYLQTKDKKYWWQMIQLLPSSYNQKRTIMLNCEVLANIYASRKNHKLDEWSVDFMDWIKTLPYSALITGTEDE